MRRDPGLAPLSKPPSLDGLDFGARVEAMVGWFYENFEDPVNETPYDGREGGYLFVHGGPFQAESYIIDAFPDATEDEHIAAIDQIDAEGPDFAPAGNRILPPEDYDEPPSEPPLGDQLAALAGQLEVIRHHVVEIRGIKSREAQESLPPGIGHNRPPRELEEDEPDLAEVLNSVDQVEAELRKPNLATADEEVLQMAESRFARFRAWLGRLAKESPTLLAKGAVTGAGGLLLKYAADHWAGLDQVLGTVIDTISTWAGIIQLMV